MFFLFVHMAR